MNLVRTIAIASFVLASGCGNAAIGGDRDEGNTAEGTTAQSLVTHRVWNGGAAWLNVAGETSWLWLDVNEGPDGAWLSFSRSSVDPTSWKCESVVYPTKGDLPPPPPGEWCRYTRSSYEYGSGKLAANDFRTLGGAARLSTTIDTAKGFWGEKCTWDEEAGTGGCAPLSIAGTISLVWEKNNKFPTATTAPASRATASTCSAGPATTASRRPTSRARSSARPSTAAERSPTPTA